MDYGNYEDIKYCIFDPTGNITALVETAVNIADQPAVAAQIMEAEPNVEQVGFVAFSDDAAADGVPVRLRMAGGEFCGNATMCAAALFAIRSGLQGGATVRVSVSGASEPIEVALDRKAATDFSAAANMPPAVKIGMIDLLPDALNTDAPDAGGLQAVGASSVSAMITLPLVKLEGISHIIIEPDSGFFGIKQDPVLAESLLRQWCSVLKADCLGLMFVSAPLGTVQDTCQPELCDQALSPSVCERVLTPLVYVPGADTMFWENSCASGTASAGMYLAAKTGKPVDITFIEPAGNLRVESDPVTGRTILHGSARLLAKQRG